MTGRAPGLPPRVPQADDWGPAVRPRIPANWLVLSAACVSPRAHPVPLSTQFHLSPPPAVLAAAAAAAEPGGAEEGAGGAGPRGRWRGRRLLASFVGRETCGLRARLRELYGPDPDFVVVADGFMIGRHSQQVAVG